LENAKLYVEIFFAASSEHIKSWTKAPNINEVIPHTVSISTFYVSEADNSGMINVISDGCSQTCTKSPSFMVTALRRFALSECFCTIWFRQ